MCGGENGCKYDSWCLWYVYVDAVEMIKWLLVYLSVVQVGVDVGSGQEGVGMDVGEMCVCRCKYWWVVVDVYLCGQLGLCGCWCVNDVGCTHIYTHPHLNGCRCRVDVGGCFNLSGTCLTVVVVLNIHTGSINFQVITSIVLDGHFVFWLEAHGESIKCI